MNDKLIQLTGQDNKGYPIDVFPYTKAKAIEFDDGKTLEEQITNHVHVKASASQNGFMSKEEFVKLLNIEPNANNYYHPATHNSNEIMHNDKSLYEILEEDNSGPSEPLPHTHNASQINTSSSRMFVTQTEKNLYSDKYTKLEADQKFQPKNTSVDTKVNSLTIGNRFCLQLNDFNELEIINSRTYEPLLVLTQEGELRVKGGVTNLT